MAVELGDKCRDLVTGFEGIAIVFMRAMTGCDQFCLQAGKVSAEGKLSDGIWFDRHRLEVIEKGAAKVPGCPPTPDVFQPRQQGGPFHTH